MHAGSSETGEGRRKRGAAGEGSTVYLAAATENQLWEATGSSEEPNKMRLRTVSVTTRRSFTPLHRDSGLALQGVRFLVPQDCTCVSSHTHTAQEALRPEASRLYLHKPVQSWTWEQRGNGGQQRSQKVDTEPKILEPR